MPNRMPVPLFAVAIAVWAALPAAAQFTITRDCILKSCPGCQLAPGEIFPSEPQCAACADKNLSAIVKCGNENKVSKAPADTSLLGRWRSPSGLSMVVGPAGEGGGHEFEGRLSAVPQHLAENYPDPAALCLKASLEEPGRFRGLFLNPSGQWVDAELLTTDDQMESRHPNGKVSWQRVVQAADPSVGSMEAAGSDPRQPRLPMTASPVARQAPPSRSVDKMYEAARAKAMSLDPAGRLVLAAYKLGNLDGGFTHATFNFHSPNLVRQRSRYDSYQVTVADSGEANATQIQLRPPEGPIPDHSPARALEAAREWWLRTWWAESSDAYLDAVLRRAKQSENLGYSVKWVWALTARSQRGDCTVLLDGESLRRLRVIIEAAPDPTPPARRR